jgi:hypothetical protein
MSNQFMLALVVALSFFGCSESTSASVVSPDASAVLAVTRYPSGARHSPMTAGVVARLRAVLASSAGHQEAFLKVGDSITATPEFLSCFDGPDVVLGAHAELEIVQAFFAGSFGRSSLAARNGLFTAQAIPLLSAELDAHPSAFAVVMLGTNDAAPDPPDMPKEPTIYAGDLRAVLSDLLTRGVVPLVSTIPPRGIPGANALVGPINDQIRAVSEELQVPLMDYHATLLALPSYGLDAIGLHPVSYLDHPCWLTAEAIAIGGMNRRNLIVLEALDRVRRFLVEGERPE